MPPHGADVMGAPAGRMGQPSKYERHVAALRSQLLPPTTHVEATRGLEGLVSDILGKVRLLICGSFAQGTAVSGSDLDLSLILPDGANRREEVRVLTKLKEGIVVKGSQRGFSVDGSILTASVPILRLSYTHPATPSADPLPIDLSIGNSSSGLRDKIVMEILAANRAVTPALAMLKHWAKRRQVTSAWDGYLNSVSWSLLFISHCQATGLLPSHHHRAAFAPPEMPTEASLLHGFFSSMLQLDADGVYEKSVLSVLTGTVLPREGGGGPVWLEDPADADNNVARSVQMKQWQWILGEVQRACDMLGEDGSWGDEASSETEEEVASSSLAQLLELTDSCDAASSGSSGDSPRCGAPTGHQPAQPPFAMPHGPPPPGAVPGMPFPWGMMPPMLFPHLPFPPPPGALPPAAAFPARNTFGFPMAPEPEFPNLSKGKDAPWAPKAEKRNSIPSPPSASPPASSPEASEDGDAPAAPARTQLRLALPTGKPKLGRAGAWGGEAPDRSGKAKRHATVQSAATLAPLQPPSTSSKGEDGSGSDGDIPRQTVTTAKPQPTASVPSTGSAPVDAYFATLRERFPALDVAAVHALASAPVPSPPCSPASPPPPTWGTALGVHDCVEITCGERGPALNGDRGVVVDCNHAAGPAAPMTIDILRLPIDGGRRPVERVQIPRKHLTKIAPPSLFHMGSWVQARGLVKDTSLNGRYGKVIDYMAATNSVTVAFEASVHHVRHENLMLALPSQGVTMPSSTSSVTLPVDSARRQVPQRIALPEAPLRGDACASSASASSLTPVAPVPLRAPAVPLATPPPQFLTYLGNVLHKKLSKQGCGNVARVTGMLVEFARKKPQRIVPLLTSDAELKSCVTLAETALQASDCRRELARSFLPRAEAQKRW